MDFDVLADGKSGKVILNRLFSNEIN
jgi:hypothetical protein